MQEIVILIVDDENDLLPVLSGFLERNGYKVMTANDGMKALKIYFENKIDLIISDIRMPEMDGITLLKKIKKHSQFTKFILMTGFSELLETKTAFELGADGFIAKPFKMKDLLQAILTTLEISDEMFSSMLDDHFQEVPIENFTKGSNIDYSIYLKLSVNRYIKVAYCGSDISYENLLKYKEKGVNHLYLIKEDYNNYFNNMKLMLKQEANKKITLSSSGKTQIVRGAEIIIAQNVFSSTLDMDVYEEANEILTQSLKIITDDNDILKLIQSISAFSNHIYTHSLCVGMFSLMLAKKMQWFNETNHLTLLMGSLFHDIGKKVLPKELCEKKLIDLIPSERKQLENHPVLGAEMLCSLEKVSENVVYIVLQHHENCMGTGYPNALKRHAIYPLAKVVSLSNEFMGSVANESDPNINIRYQKALNHIINFKKGHFEKQHLNSFCSLFKF